MSKVTQTYSSVSIPEILLDTMVFLRQFRTKNGVQTSDTHWVYICIATLYHCYCCRLCVWRREDENEHRLSSGTLGGFPEKGVTLSRDWWSSLKERSLRNFLSFYFSEHLFTNFLPATKPRASRFADDNWKNYQIKTLKVSGTWEHGYRPELPSAAM